ncbi:MAG TPA: TIGR04551 family protein, partial [Myxococcota bacterium]
AQTPTPPSTAPADPAKPAAKPEAAPAPPADPTTSQPSKDAAKPTAPATAPAASTAPTTGADAPPELPPVPGDPGTGTTTTDAPLDEMGRLKAELKNELKAEVQAELRAQLQNELEAAARDQATAKAAAQEWQEERWIEEVKPKLNFLELDGYFRFRFDVFNRLDLGTYDPVNGIGTSAIAPPTSYSPFDGSGCTDATPNNPDGTACSTTSEDTQTLISVNMRLRLDPTLNVSENIRVRSTVDILDNVVLGSAPSGTGTLADTVGTGTVGLNTIYDSFRLRRVWAEVMTPVGELRFGRMPQHFGLGLLMNNGNGLDQDAGDTADQVVFGTKIGGHLIAPAYSFSSSGPFGRGGGLGAGGDNNQGFFTNEPGQRFNLDPRDDVHTVMLTIAKRDSEVDIKEQLRLGNAVFNYGVFGAYKNQGFDIPGYFNGTLTTPVAPTDYVYRGTNAGIGSLWGRFQFEKLRIEAEAVGVVGQVAGTSTGAGVNSNDPALTTVVDGETINNPLYILQGGFALESSYAFLNDQLVVGLDGGIASGDDAPGMGNRTGLNREPRTGDADGQQYGECLEESGGDCTVVDNTITNFRFDSDYIVDMILWREVIGTVTDAFYVKPHVAYYFTPDLGLR